jgi:hypothetical protein
MILLGLLIALAAAAFGAVLLAQNWGGTRHSIEGFGYNLGSLTLAEIFLAGIILTAIFFLALWLAGLTTRMRRRAAIRRREETRSVREEREGLAADRDRLARELEDERARSRSGYPGDGGPREPYPRETYPPTGAAAAGGSGAAGYNEPGYNEPGYGEPGYREPGYTERETTTVYRENATAPEGGGYRNSPVYPADPHDPAYRGEHREGEGDHIEPVTPERDR